jgi:hypothetical protein
MFATADSSSGELSEAKHPATSTDYGGWLACEVADIDIRRNYPNWSK